MDFRIQNIRALFFLFFLGISSLYAQKWTEEIPWSIQYNSLRNKPVPVFSSAPIDLEKIRQEDKFQWQNNQQFNVARLQEIPLDIHRFSVQKLEKREGDIREREVYMMRLENESAQALALKIKRLYLPPFSAVYLYTSSKAKKFIRYQSFEEALLLEHFVSPHIKGNKMIIEVNVIRGNPETLAPKIDIQGLIHFYRDSDNEGENHTVQATGFGQSSPCELNVNCEEGKEWCQQRQSVVRILIQSGVVYSYCSGALVNTTQNDFTPYILTAEHCGALSSENDFKYWRFDFNYQSLGCVSPASELELNYNSLSGCEQIAKAAASINKGSDFRLVKLINAIPVSWQPYYAGWDARSANTIATGGVGIHHPNGDIKKISTFDEVLLSNDNKGQHTNNNYWETRWAETNNGYGITEQGSSGSPLFDYAGSIIGTLSTGSSFCNGTDQHSPDFYGKMASHWNNIPNKKSQLKAWLDPNNTGQLKIKGISANGQEACKNNIWVEEATLFPNPAQNFVQIQRNGKPFYSNSELIISQISGQMVYYEKMRTSFHNKFISLENIPNGLYILNIRNKKETIRKKLIVNRN